MWQVWRLRHSFLWMRFSRHWLHLPFTIFEIEVLKHLAMTPSQVHPTCWAYIKVYQYWCENLNGEPYVILFFHLFRFCCNSMTHTRGRWLIYIGLTIHGFGSPSELQSFEDQFFMITLVSSEAYGAVWDIDERVDGRCVNLFSKHWPKGHFLMRNHLYIHREKDLPHEALYQMDQLVKFINNLKYIKGGVLVERLKITLKAHY